MPFFHREHQQAGEGWGDSLRQVKDNAHKVLASVGLLSENAEEADVIMIKYFLLLAATCALLLFLMRCCRK
mgnify:CR=1 FL=1